MAGLNLQLDSEALEPLVRRVAEEVVRQTQAESAQFGKLAYGEAEAAALLSLAPHQLRDERLKGRIEASVGPGRKVLYSRQQLLDYLARRPWKGKQDGG